MERLTERNKNGSAALHFTPNVGKWEVCSNPPTGEYRIYGDAIDRLAAYEDTELMPEDIIKALKTLDLFTEATKGISLNRIRELAKAEQDGRMVVLPCKVGDTVWTNFAMSGWHFRKKDRPYPVRVVFIGLNNSDKMGGGLINVVYGKHDYMMEFSFSEIGKFVFLTREEAEAALKGGAE